MTEGRLNVLLELPLPPPDQGAPDVRPLQTAHKSALHIALFSELMYDFQSERWNEFELPKLSLRELLALAKLLGCPSCGSKETVIVRPLAQRELRLKLAHFTDNPGELAISYKRESLRDMCREAGIWRSGNKRALSAGLLNWRDRCRARGQAFLAEMRSLAKDRPQQLSFRL